MSLRRESRRLSRVFGALVLTLGPAALLQACSDAMTSASTPIEDASAEGDGFTPASDGTVDDATDAVTDAQLPPLDAVCSLTEIMRDADPDADPDAGPDADPGCRYFLPCGVPASAGFHLEGCIAYSGPASAPDAALECWVPEGLGCMSDVYVPPANGSVTLDCADCFGGGGRRPPGLLAPRRGRSRAEGRSRSAVGAYFAQMAYDEAASVHAFMGLEEDLTRLGAPAELIAAAARSARDEVRHARVMARRARACGGVVTVPRVRRRVPRSLESIARENAVEGCIHETFGALQLRWQAAHAPDASMRRLFARVAADETRHAALSWLVAQWAEPLLDAAARKRVTAARSRATRALRTKLSAPRLSDPRKLVSCDSHDLPALDPLVGRPPPERALALLDGLLAQLNEASAAG